MEADPETKSDAGKTELFASRTLNRKIYARIWRGRTRAADLDSYADYLYRFGVLKIERMEGNLGVQMFCTVVAEVAEFTVTSFWPTLDSIRVWSGDDLTKTRHLAKDPDYLLVLPERVTLVEVYANDWRLR